MLRIQGEDSVQEIPVPIPSRIVCLHFRHQNYEN